MDFGRSWRYFLGKWGWHGAVQFLKAFFSSKTLKSCCEKGEMFTTDMNIGIWYKGRTGNIYTYLTIKILGISTEYLHEFSLRGMVI